MLDGPRQRVGALAVAVRVVGARVGCIGSSDVLERYEGLLSQSGTWFGAARRLARVAGFAGATAPILAVE